MSNKNGGSAAGVGFLELLFIVFLVLKLTGTIAWSWWWITAPIWIPLAAIVIIIIIALLIDHFC